MSDLEAPDEFSSKLVLKNFFKEDSKEIDDCEKKETVDLKQKTNEHLNEINKYNENHNNKNQNNEENKKHQKTRNIKVNNFDKKFYLKKKVC